VRLRMAVALERIAVRLPDPQQFVARGVEPQDHLPKLVGLHGRVERVPGLAPVRRGVVLFPGRDEVRALVRKLVVVERHELLVGLYLGPAVALGFGLPHRAVLTPDEDRLRVVEVGVLGDLGREGERLVRDGAFGVLSYIEKKTKKKGLER
jgi:hypothetical protein